MTIKIIISNKNINESCNFQVVFTDNIFTNNNYLQKIILINNCNLINNTNIDVKYPYVNNDVKYPYVNNDVKYPYVNNDVKYPYASEYYTVNGYKITLLYLSICLNIQEKQKIFIKDELNKNSDVYIIFIEKYIDILDVFNKHIIITSTSNINKKNIISLNNHDYIYLEIGNKIKYKYKNMNLIKIDY
jgi:hypothetical protein